MTDYIVSMEGINKSFGGVHALKGVDLNIKKGEVHCLAGENGSGKSTVIKVLSGVYKPDSGKIKVHESEYEEMNPVEAIKHGIQIIYQDFSVFPNLTVLENLALNKVVSEGRKFVNRAEFRRIAETAVSKIGFNVDLDELVGTLPVADKQLIAISRALLDNAQLIVMDEPTTALTKTEVQRLFSIINQLKDEGVTILFVSHKLDEVFEICDHVTIFRNGENVISSPVSEMTEEKFSYYMTGRRFDMETPITEKTIGNTILETQNLSGRNYDDVNMTVKQGEILGITGQLGSGRTELTLSLFGLLSPDSGKIVMDGKEVNINSPKEAQKLGVALVPEDRLTEGLFLPQSIKRNTITAKLEEFTNSFGIFNQKEIDEASNEAVEKFSVATADDELPVSTLSGGNQQKVLLARWIGTNPKLLILNGPTAGVDIGAKHDIYKILRELSQEGVGIIIGSDDIREIIQTCDRVLVMEKGQIKHEITKDELNQDVLSQYI